MGRNLAYQFRYAVEKNFSEGMDKHSLKKTEGLGNGKVFSYADRKNLIDLSKQFGKWMQENNRDIRMVKEIRPEHIQDFLKEKAKSCTTTTLENYEARFQKLSKVVNLTYRVNTNYTKGVICPNGKEKSVRDISMSKEDYNRLKEQIGGSKSSAKIAVELTGRFGLRVAETTNVQPRDIHILGSKAILHVHSGKGGRNRDIEVTRKEDLRFLRELKENYQGSETMRYVTITENSINRFVARNMEKAGIREKYAECKTNLHAIRKMAAQNYYNELKEKGYSKVDAWNQTSNMLGHGENRNDLYNVYIAEK